MIKPSSVFDLGANTGIFSRLSSNKNIPTISFDIDPLAVEKNYLKSKQENEENILPLILDLTNPSPAIGWGNIERKSIIGRSSSDLILALALIHHLVISNNIPLDRLAQLFSELGQYLLIEFIPKSDSQVQRLLLTREDIFDKYDQEHFEEDFSKFFEIIQSKKISDSTRSIYIMKKLENQG